MEEFKAKSHAVKKMTRKGLVETDSREGIVKETAEAKSDGRRINEADFQLERKGAQSRADPVDDKPVSDAKNFKVIEDVLHAQRGPGAVVCNAPTHLPLTADVNVIPVAYL